MSFEWCCALRRSRIGERARRTCMCAGHVTGRQLRSRNTARLSFHWFFLLTFLHAGSHFEMGIGICRPQRSEAARREHLRRTEPVASCDRCDLDAVVVRHQAQEHVASVGELLPRLHRWLPTRACQPLPSRAGRHLLPGV